MQSIALTSRNTTPPGAAQVPERPDTIDIQSRNNSEGAGFVDRYPDACPPGELALDGSSWIACRPG